MEQADLLADAQWARLIQDTAEHFDEVTLSRGFTYYKQGRVGRLKIKERSSIEAVVEGTEGYQVSILLSHFADSSCTCPVDGFCKHIAAVLMEYAAQQGRSVHVLVNARANRTMATAAPSAKQADRKAMPVPAQGLSVAIQRQQIVEEAGTLDLLSIPQWHRLFERCTISLRHDVRNSAYAEQALGLIFSLKPKLPPLLELLFGLHAHLFVQQSLLQTGKGTGGLVFNGSHIGYFTHIAVADMDRAILLSLEEGTRLTGLGNSRAPIDEEIRLVPQLTQTLDYLRSEMLAEPKDLFYFSRYYRIFLEEWMAKAEDAARLFEDELVRLEPSEQDSEAAEPLAASPIRYSRLMARSRLLLLLSRDEEAWELLQEAGSRAGLRQEDVSGWLDLLQQSQDSRKLTACLEKLGPLLTGSRPALLDQYFQLWEKAAEQEAEAEPKMWDALSGMLPGAGRFYEQKLFAHGKWREWIDYQLSAGSDPLEYRARDLQLIEKDEPALLLPFYHQAAERYVTHKNRDSYKKAVKLLKRLAKLYAKMKQEARWELFLASFTARYSRLRALQEELRKGKLIG